MVSLNWQPMYHWTDSKIRVHALYCLALFLLHGVLRQARTFWPQLTLEKLQEEQGRFSSSYCYVPRAGRGSAPQGDGARHPKSGPKRVGRDLGRSEQLF